MALSLSQTAYLASILRPGMRVASFGYPDIIAPPEGIERMVGDKLSSLVHRADSKEICRRHGLKERPIPDAQSLFSLLDCKLDVYDIVAERGCELLCDLNEPFAPDETGTKMVGRNEISWATPKRYDIVLDVGTAEHCFNIGQALMNMAAMAKAGGYIIHENPFCSGNHGFYGLNPTLFHDFYTQNGFEILECMLVTRDGRKADVPRDTRFRFVGEESNVFAVARRVEIRPFVYPVQSKYAHLIPDAGVVRAKRDADASGDRSNAHG